MKPGKRHKSYRHLRPNPTPPQLAWLVGILEGEGSFIVTNTRHAFYVEPRHVPIVTVNMTDLDIIERVAALFQTDIFTLLPKKPNRKTAYRVAARGAYGARWMKLLYPYMGKRRKRQIRKSLTIYENRPYNAKTRVKACQKAAKGRQRNERGQFT